jgi:hypothetical protein
MSPLSDNIRKSGPTTWKNAHRNFDLEVDCIYDVWKPRASNLLEMLHETVASLQGLIAESIQSGQRLRALGNGWSFSDVAYTNGCLVNTLPLDSIFDISDRSRSADYPGDPESLIFAQCGTLIAQLNKDLEARGRSLPASGASNGQSIAGALSTGTHGSAYKVGAIPDFVVGLHLVVGPDRHVWLERASYPVVSDGFIANLGAEAIRDDDVFNAALVSFGSFGIIHGVMLESVPIFYLQKHREWRPLTPQLKDAMRTLDFSGIPLPGGDSDPYHFEMVVNPYRDDDEVFLRIVTQSATAPPARSRDDDRTSSDYGDDVPGFIGGLADLSPASVPILVNLLLGERLDSGSSGVRTLGGTFNSSNTHGNVASMALGIPAERAPDAFDLLMGVHERSESPFAGVFAFRWAPKTKATLGFQRFGPHTCIVELDGLDNKDSTIFRSEVVKAFDDAALPFTFHWGKLNQDLSPERLRASYGDAAVDSWLSARATLLSAQCADVFTNPFLERVGLA